MSLYRTLSRHASHYLSGRVLLLLLGFVSFPLLTRVFSVQQYGEISLILKCVVCLVVLAKLGVQNAVVRFFEESRTDDRAARERFYSTFFFGALGVAAMTGIALFLTYRSLPAGVRIQDFNVQELRVPLLCAALLVTIRAVWSIVSGFFQAEGRTVTYNVLDISTKALSVAAMLAAFAWWGRTLNVFFEASVGAEAAVVTLAVLLVAQRGVLRPRSFDARLFRMAIVYGLPLAAYEISSIVLDGGDRFLVLHLLGTRPLGLYSAAYNLSAYTQVSVMAPINLAIIPIYMRLWRERGIAETRDFLSRTLDGFVILASGVFLFGSIVAGPLLIALASAKYAEAARLLPMLIAAMLVYALHIFLTPGLLIYKKTAVLARQVAYSTVLNLALNAVLLPRLGILGGALSTLLAYVFLVVILARASHSMLPVSFPWKPAIFRITLAGGLYLLASEVMSQVSRRVLPMSVLVACLALLVYAAALAALDPTARRWMEERLTRLRAAADVQRDRVATETSQA